MKFGLRNAQELKHIKLCFQQKATTQTSTKTIGQQTKRKKNHEVRLNRIYRRTGRFWMIMVCASRPIAMPMCFLRERRISSVCAMRCFLFLSSSFLFIACTFHSLISSSFCCFWIPGVAVVVARHSYCRTLIYIYVQFIKQPKQKKKH